MEMMCVLIFVFGVYAIIVLKDKFEMSAYRNEYKNKVWEYYQMYPEKFLEHLQNQIKLIDRYIPDEYIPKYIHNNQVIDQWIIKTRTGLTKREFESLCNSIELIEYTFVSSWKSEIERVIVKEQNAKKIAELKQDYGKWFKE